MTDYQIKHMVDRFLNYRLPENWKPDGGISFEKFGNKGTPHQYTREPSGTNLLDAMQAEVMVRHMLDGLWKPIETAPRDGTPFLCFHHGDGEECSPQTSIDLVWYERSIKTYTMDGDTEVPFAGITHWMPLPTPPVSSKDL